MNAQIPRVLDQLLKYDQSADDICLSISTVSVNRNIVGYNKHVLVITVDVVFLVTYS